MYTAELGAKTVQKLSKIEIWTYIVYENKPFANPEHHVTTFLWGIKYRTDTHVTVCYKKIRSFSAGAARALKPICMLFMFPCQVVCDMLELFFISFL